jgi:DNA-binding transcriptional ArsR family regulator
MPNSKGMDPKTKMRTLDVLEKAGLISVNRRDRKSPVVTLTISIF